MKTKAILIAVIGILFCCNSYSDVIPDNVHSLFHCVKITNISDYKGILLIGNVKEIGGGQYSYIINDSTCLEKGYRFNSLFIYATSTDYILNKDLDEITWEGNQNASVANVNIEPAGGYVDNSNPIKIHEEYYKIMGFTDVTVVLHKWKEVFKFNNGTPDSVVTYNYTDNGISLIQDFFLARKEVIPDNFKILIFPNPTHDFLNIDLKNFYSGKVNFELYDMNGKIVNSSLFKLNGNHSYYNKLNSNNSFYRIPISNLPKGTYYLRTVYKDWIDTQKIVIE